MYGQYPYIGGRVNAGGSRHAQEDEHGTVQTHHIFIAKTPDTHADLRLWHGGDLVHHQAARCPEAIRFIRFDRQTKQGGVGRVGREGADRDGGRGVEPIILQDHDRARLARITLAGGDGPNLAAFHSASQKAPSSETASMKTWSC